MEKKHRFHIYDRKEFGVLILLGVAVAVFAFTLGLHLGKKVQVKSGQAQTALGQPITPVSEASPTVDLEHEIAQKSADEPNSAHSGTAGAAGGATEELVNQASHDEVTRTGIKLEDPRQLQLPTDSRSKSGGAVTATADTAEATPAPPAEEKAAPAAHAPAHVPAHVATPAQGSFTLQIGSFAELKEAQDRVKDLQISGLKPRIHEAKVEGKGQWYRLYMGTFASRQEAAKAGQKYKAQGLIETFVVAKSVD